MTDSIILASDLRLMTDVSNISVRPNYPVQKPLDLPSGGPGSIDERRQTVSTVLYDDAAGIYRMWYIAAPTFNGTLASGHIPAYAESRDGVHWTKPDLGLVEFNGSSHNNLVAGLPDRMDGISVVQLPDHSFIAAIFDASVLTREEVTTVPNIFEIFPSDMPQPAFTGIARSTDGVRWHYEGDGHAVIKEKFELGRLYLSDGVFYLNGQQGYPYIPQYGRNAVTYQSTNLKDWTKCPDVYSVDDGKWEQCHVGIAPCVQIGPTYVGLAGHFHDAPELPEQNFDIDLVYSNDKLTWYRPCPHTPWLRRGEPTAWNGQGLRQAQGVAVNGDEMYVYFVAATVGNELSSSHIPAYGTILRNRFAFATIQVGWDINNWELRTATLRTPCFQRGDATEVVLNCDNFKKDGAIRITLTDAQGIPLDGFTDDNCIPVTTAGLAVPVQWRNDSKALPDEFCVRATLQGRGLSPDMPYLYTIECR